MNKQHQRDGFRTCQTSKIERFTRTLNNWKTLIGFVKRTVLDVRQGSKCASFISNIIVINWLIIYLNLLLRHPKCHTRASWSFEPFYMVFIILQPPSMFARFRCWLKQHVGTSPSSCNKHSSFYFLDQYLGASRPKTTIWFLYFQNCLIFATFFAKLLIFFQEHLQSVIIYWTAFFLSI